MLIINSSLFSQDKEKFNLLMEIPVKVSLPYYSIQDVPFNETVIYKAPLWEKYRNPVFGINIGFLYQMNEKFRLGLVTGVLGEISEQHSFFKNEYYHRFMFPLYGKLRYQTPLSAKKNLFFDTNIGYQFSSLYLDNDPAGFFFISKGRFLGGIDLGTNFKIYNYTVLLKIGYEINQYKNTDRIDWGSWSYLLKPEDSVSYYTYYQVIKLGIEIDF